jgi:hypothetical protein
VVTRREVNTQRPEAERGVWLMVSARILVQTSGVRSRRAAAWVSAATGVSAGATAANRLGAVSASTLASTPQAVAEGKVWLIGTSALLADRPALPSLVGFWIVGLVVLLVCSARLAVGVAVAGHSLSALGIYGLLGVVRLVEPNAFGSLLAAADYGLSAIIAAWLGAVAAVSWRRWPSAVARVVIAAGSLGCAGVGIAFQPDVTFLDSEHLLAFAIGFVLADGRWIVGRPVARLFRCAAPAVRAVAATVPNRLSAAAPGTSRRA